MGSYELRVFIAPLVRKFRKRETYEWRVGIQMARSDKNL